MASKLGNLTRVENTKRYNSATPEYIHVHVYEGDELVSLLLTEKELGVAKKRASKNPEDIPEFVEPQVHVEGVCIKNVEYKQGDVIIEV